MEMPKIFIDLYEEQYGPRESKPLLLDNWECDYPLPSIPGDNDWIEAKDGALWWVVQVIWKHDGSVKLICVRE